MSSGHTLPDLPYAYDGLEPYISRQIMELHHRKHHQTYVNALNAAEAAYSKTSTPRERIALQAALKFNGGGAPYQSFSLLEESAPSAAEGKGHGGVLKDGPLKDAIVHGWGSYDNFKKEFNTTTAGIQGSGWGWLPPKGSRSPPQPIRILSFPPPIIGVDIWEHAFYLQYLNVKADYLNAIWNVIDLQEAEKRYLEASSGSRL
ncbi:manganese superoxide dismutase [Lactarius quietus]|nr:manganese superoxide dismutase [Lactarius quietus]